MANADGGQQAPGHMPEVFIIGTAKAFANDTAYKYYKKQIGSETIYMGIKGSKWARTGEVWTPARMH